MKPAEKGNSAAEMRRLLRYLSAGRARMVGQAASTRGADVALQREAEAVRRFRGDLLRAADRAGAGRLPGRTGLPGGRRPRLAEAFDVRIRGRPVRSPARRSRETA